MPTPARALLRLEAVREWIAAGVCAWHFVRVGACQECERPRCRLYTPVLAGAARAVVAPLLCAACRSRRDLA